MTPSSLPPAGSTDEPSDADLGHYIAGAADPDTRQCVDAWLASSEDHRQYLDRLRSAWDAGRRPQITGDVETFLHTFRQVRSGDRRHVEPSVRTPKGAGWNGGTFAQYRRIPRAYVTAVAVVCVAAAVFVSSRWFQEHRAGSQSQSVRTYTTGNAQRTTIQLPDGSSVVLAPASQLEIASGFERGERRVTVTGEALFAVQPRVNQPFIVHAGQTVTQVLGTVFAVRRYPEDTAVRVVVTQGRVATSTTGHANPGHTTRRAYDSSPNASLSYGPSTIVNAGQVAYILSGNQTTVTSAASPATVLGWAEGRLVVQDTPVRDLLPEFRRFYDIPVTTDDPYLLSRRVTATFGAMPSSEALAVLQDMLGVTAVREGRSVVLYQSSANIHHGKH